MNILEKIVVTKRKEVEHAKAEKPLSVLKESKYYSRKCYSLSEYILSDTKSGLICEFKRKSPSKGIINGHSSLKDVVLSYQDNGASAVSVLTDSEYFGGSSEDLTKAREVLDVPILRKDFIIDKYQIHEAKAMGADAILLIASILSKEEIEEFAEEAKSLGLSVLFEIHNEEELQKLNNNISIVGVNNRNLENFEVSIEVSKSLSSKIPSNCLKVSESGISNTKLIKELKKYSYKGFLIGENFMKVENPAEKVEEFVNDLKL